MKNIILFILLFSISLFAIERDEIVPVMTKKIRKLKSMIVENGYDTKIFVDGGINVETAPLAVKSGADVLVAASAIFGKDDVKTAVKNLREAALKALNKDLDSNKDRQVKHNG